MHTRTLAAFLTLVLAGCAATQKDPPPLPFAGTRWQLVMELPIAGDGPWVRFGDGRLTGFFGCNVVTGNYLQDTVGARAIAIGRLERTTRLCDAEVVAVERRLLETLQSVSSYSITADAMSMSGSGGTLRFRAASTEAR